MKAIYIVDLKLPLFFSTGEREAVEASLTNPSSMMENAVISNTAIMKAYEVLESENLLAEGWAQGKKALGSIPVCKINAVRNMVAAMKKKSSVATLNVRNIN